MRTLTDPESHLVYRFPDCAACGDVGAILMPSLHWKGRHYLGHGGDCTCRACRGLSPAMRAWLDQEVAAGRVRALPEAAKAAIDARMVVPDDELRYCPCCPAGETARDLYRASQERDAAGRRTQFILNVPAPTAIDPRSEEGRVLLDAARQSQERFPELSAEERVAKILLFVRNMTRRGARSPDAAAPSRHPAYGRQMPPAA